MSRPRPPARRTILTACALAAVVNLAAAVMLAPRVDAPAPVAAESQPAASVRAQSAPAPPAPSVRTPPAPPPAASVPTPPAPLPRPAAVATPPAPPPPSAAEPPPRISAVPRAAPDLPPRDASRAADRAALRAALDDWIAATNRRDLERQMTFYPATVAVFYRERNVPRSAVLAEKRRLFARAQVVDVQAATPDITIDGAAATMRFRKTYDIRGPQATRRGEVVQELRWAKTPAGWKITGERDVEVVR